MANYIYGMLILLASFTLGACHNHSEREHEHESNTENQNAHTANHEKSHATEEAHAHEEANQLLFINSDIELFAEVVNHHDELEITAHFTHLKNYRPIRNEQPVWKVFGKDNKLLGQTKLQHVQEGIYSGIIAVHAHSDLKHQFQITSENKKHLLNAENNNFKSEGKGNITYLKEQAWKDKFSVYRATKEPFSRVLQTSGITALHPDKEDIVSASNRGIVNFEGPLLLAGQRIKKGQQILTIQNNENNLNNNNIVYNNARRTYQKAKKDFNRAEDLWKENIISEKAYLQTKLEYENAKNRFEVLAENFSDGGRIIRASRNGYIGEVFVNNGQHVTAGQPLVKIIETDKILLKADVSQKDAGYLSQIEKASFKLQGIDTTFTTGPLSNSQLIYGKTMQGAFAIVAIVVDKSHNIVPGAYADVFLKLKNSTPEVLIPKIALMESEGNHYVYVMTGGETFEKRDIITGQHDGKNVVVKEGLADGEYIVIDGAYNIKLASVSGNIPSHHSH